MSPEYGATCGFFPVDDVTLEYLRLTGRDEQRIALVEAYCKENLLWHDPEHEPTYSEIVELDLGDVEPSLAGPRRPQDRVPLDGGEALVPRRARDLRRRLRQRARRGGRGVVPRQRSAGRQRARDTGRSLSPEPVEVPDVVVAERAKAVPVELDGDTVRARARRGRDRCDHELHEHVEPERDGRRRPRSRRRRPSAGLERKPWVKSSLAPGSKVVTEYYERAGLTPYLEELGFHTVGYGCTTCIGNSGPLPEPISKAVAEGDLVVCSVLSGNRNFEARIHPEVKANYLASPPLVVAYALAGRMDIDLTTEPLGQGSDGEDVYLARHLADRRGDRRDGQVGGRGRHVPAHVRRRLHRRRALARARDPRGRPLRLARGVDLRPAAAVLRRDVARARNGRGHPRRALPRPGRRLGHDRPHLAGRRDQAGQPGGQVPDRARRRAEGLQLLRLAARKPRGDGARHVRQRPAEEPARAGQRGHVDGRTSPTARR